MREVIPDSVKNISIVLRGKFGMSASLNLFMTLRVATKEDSGGSNSPLHGD